MAGAAFFDDVQLPSGALDPADFMRGVAIDTNRRAGTSRVDRPTVNACDIIGQDSRMARAAGRWNADAVNLGLGVALGLDIMGAMATRTMGGHQKAAFRQRASVNRIHVKLVGVGDWNVVLLRQFRIAMTGAAG